MRENIAPTDLALQPKTQCKFKVLQLFCIGMYRSDVCQTQPCNGLLNGESECTV